MSQRVERHRGEQDDRHLRQGAVAGLADGEPGRDGDRRHHAEQGEQRHPAPAQHHGTGDRQEAERPVRPQPDAGDLVGRAADRVESQLEERVAHAPGAGLPGDDDRRQPAAMLAHVVERHVAQLEVAGRRVAVARLRRRLRQAAVAPRPDLVVVHVVAVGRRQRLAEVGGQHHRLLEAGRVVGGPGHDGQQSRGERQARPAQPGSGAGSAVAARSRGAPRAARAAGPRAGSWSAARRSAPSARPAGGRGTPGSRRWRGCPGP